MVSLRRTLPAALGVGLSGCDTLLADVGIEQPALLGEADTGIWVRFGGPSCLAGDVIGRYCLASAPQIGDRIAFLDQAHYSMVKTTMFNGVPLPAIMLWDSRDDSLQTIRQFSFSDFEGRLS